MRGQQQPAFVAVANICGEAERNVNQKSSRGEINDLKSNAALCIHRHTPALSTFTISVCFMIHQETVQEVDLSIFTASLSLSLSPASSSFLRCSQIFSHHLITVASVLLNLPSHLLSSMSPCFLFLTLCWTTVLSYFIQYSTLSGQ